MADQQQAEHELIARVVSIADTALDVTEPYAKRAAAARDLIDLQVAHLVSLAKHYEDPANAKDMETFVTGFVKSFLSVATAQDKAAALADVLKRAADEAGGT